MSRSSRVPVSSAVTLVHPSVSPFSAVNSGDPSHAVLPARLPLLQHQLDRDTFLL